MINVIAGGDSFVYGSELKDCRDNLTIGQHGHSNQTFSGLLAKGNEYVCVAWPGFGNDSIARSVINYCEQTKPSNPVVLVSWTFPGRYEFRFTYDTGQKNSPWYTITPWTTVTSQETSKEYHNNDYWVEFYQDLHVERAKKTGIYEFANNFYHNVGSSEYWEIYSTLKEIVYLQNYLKVKQVPYLFTCADNSIFYNHTVNVADVTISGLLQQIDLTNWFWFPEGTGPQDTQNPRGFYQWAVENKYPIGTTHPLEEAHRDAAQLLQGKFNEMVKKYLG